ncbi:DUF4347 domain-containing protein [Marinomonas sp. 15G1-11]|uniref:DUF4347 domain-containing protein n=1 Tax=Marinomonas phaeophyticola TaxID=3004091 RepID=A0ABT4JSH0_9GAMM|nr:DUF4347 domain-containing protein [Marinomonas sp. 15G1-11]MCZ2721330.1 DUF4347 domain-containing protein [Marinomonas sp. 15G1-11]
MPHAIEHSILFVDTHVDDYMTLINGVEHATKIVILHPDQDGIEQISQTLNQHAELEEIHILSHGSEAELVIGNGSLNQSNLDAYQSLLKNWSNALSDTAGIVLYGCNVAKGAIGQHFIQQLAALTGASVTASNNLTGSAELGGGWSFESTNKEKTTDLIFSVAARQQYPFTLTPIPIEPTLTSATYDAASGTLIITGTDFTSSGGDDVIASKITLTGEGGETYTLTDTANVEISSATAATLILSVTDKDRLNQIFNKDGSSSTSSTIYDIDGAAGFIANSPGSADTDNNSVTVSHVPAPTITSSTFDAATGTLVITGTGFLKKSGASNDVDITRLSFTGNQGNSYQLTNNSGVEISSSTSASIILSDTDKMHILGLLNKNGTAAEDATTYNLIAAENWMTGAASPNNVADSVNVITVSNVTGPTLSSVNYNPITGLLEVTGTHFFKKFGADNDIDVSRLTFTGEMGNSYTLTTTADVDISSSSRFSVILTGTDKTDIDILLNKKGSTSLDSTVYNLAFSDGWLTGADNSTDISDSTMAVLVSDRPPQLADKSPSLATIEEDLGPPNHLSTLNSTLISDLINQGGSLDNYSDQDGDVLGGIAITGISAFGSLYYDDVIGGNSYWYKLTRANISETNAFALQADTRIYFKPDKDFHGTLSDAFTFQAMSASSYSSQFVDITSSSLFSKESDTVSVTINSINDAPILSVLMDSGQRLGSSSSRDVTLADVDGDGDLDMIEANSFSQPNRIWLNDGIGNFTDSGQTLGNDVSYGLAVGDLDGDGDQDIVASSDGGANHIYINDGHGNFTESSQMLASSDSQNVFLGDLDGDGDLDMIDLTSGPNRVFINNGAGLFTDSTQVLGGSGVSSDAAIGDVDGDGDQDIVIANSQGNENRLWLNDGHGVFSDSGQLLGSNDSRRLVMADFDGDNDLDLVFVNRNATGEQIYFNNGQGIFTDSGQTLTNGEESAISAGDIDGDGDLDLFISNSLEQPDTLWLNNGKGMFTDSGLSIGLSSGNGNAIGDIDNDGDLDVVIANNLQQNWVWMNNGTNTSTLVEGRSVAIKLNGYDPDDSGTELNYTVTSAPSYGQLELSNAPGVSISTFTQDDIDNDRVIYKHQGNNASTDNFEFTLSDGGENGAGVATGTFTITVTRASQPQSPFTTIDGTQVLIQETTNAQGETVSTTTISPVVASRIDNNTGHLELADIPLLFTDNTRTIAKLAVGLPINIGITATGIATPLTPNKAIEELISLINTKVSNNDSSKDAMLANANAFLKQLNAEPGKTLVVHSLVMTVGDALALAPEEAILISGSSQSQSEVPDAVQEALIIDASALPPGTMINLQDVEFAIIIGPITLGGGDGKNIVFADSSSHTIVLGAEDDELHGGGGDDFIGSRGGDDRLFGDDGNDRVIGGEGNDYLEGGIGDDVLQGGQSDAGTFSFHLTQQDTLFVAFKANNLATAEQDNIDFILEQNTEWTSDMRMAFTRDISSLKTISLLYQAALDKLPTVEEVNALLAFNYTDSQLANLAYRAYLEQNRGLSNLTLEEKMTRLMSSIWGESRVTKEDVQSGVDYLSNKGTWIDGFLILSQHDNHIKSLITSKNELKLVDDFNTDETGWSSDTGNDVLFGGEGNDILVGGSGSDILNGGDGTDIIVQYGADTNYQFLIGIEGLILSRLGTQERDTLIDVEQLVLSDQTVNISSSNLAIENLHSITALYQLMTRDAPTLIYLNNAEAEPINLAAQAEALMLDVRYQQKWGQMDNATFVRELSTDIFGTAFQGEDLAYWTDGLDSGNISRGDTFVSAVGVQSYQEEIFKGDGVLIL